MTTRVGEVIQAGFRDASLAGNTAGAKQRDDARFADTAVKILKDNGIYSEVMRPFTNVVCLCAATCARVQEFRNSIKRDHLLWVLIALGPVFALFCIIRVDPDPRDDTPVVLPLSSDAAEPTVHRLGQLLAAARRRSIPHRADQYAAVLRDGGRHHAGARVRDRGAAALDREASRRSTSCCSTSRW